MKKVVPLINAINTGRFPQLLSRILQKLHLKAESSFSEEEEEKLQAAFSLEKRELRLVLETISFVLEQNKSQREASGTAAATRDYSFHARQSRSICQCLVGYGSRDG